MGEYSFFEVTGENEKILPSTGIFATLAEADEWVTAFVNDDDRDTFAFPWEQTLRLSVHRPEGVVEYDLMPRLRLRIPGFTEFGFDEDHLPVWDEDPDEPYDPDDPDTDPCVLLFWAAEAFGRCAGEIGVRLDWPPDIAPLVNPLPVGGTVELRDRVLTYGHNETTREGA